MADETRALLVRLMAYAGILAGVVLIGMELVSGGEAALAEFADYISKTKAYETSTRIEAALGDASANDRMPAAETLPDRSAGPQAPAAATVAPPPRDRLRRQRLLEPAQSPASPPCPELRKDQGKELGKELGPAKAGRERCHTAASADWVTAKEAPGLRGRI